jgi:gliding motility-associated-like protein
MRITLYRILILFFIFPCLPAHAQVINTIAGNNPGFSGDGGLAIFAQFANPISIAQDNAGNTYVCDADNNRLRKINNTTGIITTIAGTGTAGFSGDGGLAVNAQITYPTDICIDANNNIYFIDAQNFRVRKIEFATGIITTVAGNGGGNYFGGTLPAINAGIHYPNGLAIDATNLYLSLFSQQLICKVELSTGILSTIAGNGTNGFSGDGGPAINASFGYPTGLSVTANGDLYIADYNNNRIRKIAAASGIVSTVAGNGLPGFSGDGGPAIAASLNLPTGVFVDANGNIFIADRNNYRIRKVSAASGIISTVAGSGGYGYGGDGYSATSSCTKLADPHKVIVDAAGNMFIADQSNTRIRKVDTNPPPAGATSISINSSATQFCLGSTVIFKAIITNGLSTNFYSWKKNAVSVGTNSDTYSTTTLKDGDIITCETTGLSGCGYVTVVSNAIPVSVTQSGAIPTVTISSDATAACAGTLITFTAAPKYGGNTPIYQWKKNGIVSGNNSTTFSANNFANGDIITCVLTSNDPCAAVASAISNSINIKINQPVTPSVNIKSNAASACSGSTVIFTATATNSGANPTYQWKVNNINAGLNNSLFSSTTLQNGDIVKCSMTADPGLLCTTVSAALSNEITAVIINNTASIKISASDNNFCKGTPVNFTASAQNAGANPSYQWKINNINTGSNNPVYSNPGLNNNDKVECIISNTNTACPALEVPSNNIVMQVKASPVVSITPSSIAITVGNSAKFSATVTGNIDHYEWTPADHLIDPITLKPETIKLNETTAFLLKVKNTEDCTDTASVTVNVFIPLAMPTAFTPNNDGINDVFRIPPHMAITLSEFSIYDRWGKKIFFTTDVAKGWDGKLAGIPSSTGAFVYIIRGVSFGKQVLLKGTFTLIR